MAQNRMILGFMLEFRVQCISDFIVWSFWWPVATSCPVSIDFDPGASNIDKRFFIFHWCINVCFCYTRIAYWCNQFFTQNDFEFLF